MKSHDILVGSRTYSVTVLGRECFFQTLSKLGVEDDSVDDSVKSFINYDTQTIVLRGDLKRDHLRELVVHELLHACLEDAGFDQDDVSEKLIRVLSPRLSCLLSNNVLNDLLDES